MTCGGVDAGGSHTEAVVSDCEINASNARDDARHVGPGAAVRPDNIDVVASLIFDALHRAMAKAGAEYVEAAVVGAAGAGRDAERKGLTNALENRLGPKARVLVTTDGEIALEDAFPNGSPGIVLLAGTGSVAFARDERGAITRSGGLGSQLGDEGSGYDIGRAALGAVGRAADQRGPLTALSQGIQSLTNTSTLDDLVRWAQLANREQVAGLTRAVCDAALDGDDVARDLVHRAGTCLGQHVEALAHRFEPGDVRVALAGRVLTPGSPVRSATVSYILSRVPQASLVDHEIDPAWGALKLAARLMLPSN